jgi:hypothetical protein
MSPAAELLLKALSSNLPAKEVRKLVQSLPVQIVQAVLADAAVPQDTGATAFATLTSESPMPAWRSDLVNGTWGLGSSDAAAAEQLENALSAGLSAKEMRTLVRSLPLHVVQAVLGRVSVVEDSPQVSGPLEATSDPAGLGAFALADLREDWVSPDEARAALLRKASKVNLPVSVVRLLERSLSPRTDESELSKVGQMRAWPVSANSASDSDTRELFRLALAAELPSEVLRSIANALPSGAVQSELSRGVAPRTTPASRL